jgi:murein DD-endopeptidase MepM/ murein hydrolase activator NlpD
LIYDAPVGTAAERASGIIWPGKWFDANPYGNHYQFPDGSWHYHTGADLNLNDPIWNADANSPVYSIGDGVVIYAKLVINSNGQPSTWGRLVVVRHPDGACSRYGHLRTLNVATGFVVEKGNLIGTVGGSEYGMPDHLHFDISQSGILETNPTYWPGDNLTAVLQHFVEPKGFLS